MFNIFIMVLVVWAAISIFMVFVFCSTARMFVCEPDQDVTSLSDNVMANREKTIADEIYTRRNTQVNSAANSNFRHLEIT